MMRNRKIITLFGGTMLFLAIASLMVAELASSQSKNGGDRIIESLSLSNANIQAVLTYIGDYGGKNIIAAPTVDGNITMKIRDVTWRQALDIIMETYGYTAVESADHITVLPTAEYQKKLAQEDQFQFDRRLRKDVGTKVVNIRYASAKDLEKPVKTMLSERGNIDTDQRTNSLIIRDIPEYIERAESLIAQLDTETKQVRISAQLLEVESHYFREIGFDWSMMSRTSIDHPNIELDGGATNSYTPEGEGSQTTTDNIIQSTAKFKISQIVNDKFNVDAIVDAIVSSNKGRILGHPEVITVDNLQAKIQMGQKIPIKQFDEAGNVVTKFYDVGIQLKVTPHITAQDRILMNLEPERSDYSFDANGIIINTQNATTNVVVNDGQTVVIGGLTSQEDRDIEIGVPLLKDIPLLGALFRYTKKEVKSRDLVIFVTPTIISHEIAANEVQEEK